MMVNITVRERVVEIIGSIREAVLQAQCPEIAIATNKRLSNGSKREISVRLFESANKSRRFVVYVAVLYYILEILDSGQIITERDLYYKDVTLFKRQADVSRAVQTIADTLGVSRRELNITASAKGLVWGDMSIFGTGGEVAVIRRTDGPRLLGSAPEHVRIHGSPKYVLLIEKDAVFKQIVEDGQFDEALCVTGKGFPDLVTREILCKISVAEPRLPIYGLVDADPYGVQILGTYMFGSDRFQENPQCPRIRYLGLTLGDVELPRFNQLTRRDRKYAMSMLRRRKWIDQAPDLKRQLQLMLFFNAKAELNGNKSILGVVNTIITKATQKSNVL